MKVIFAILMASFLCVGNVYADACGPFGCLLQVGTVCVDGKCVPKNQPTPTPTVNPTPTPTPTISVSDIRMDLVPFKDIVVKEVDCSGMDMKNIRVFLKRKYPPPGVSFYSIIYYQYLDLSKNPTTSFHMARKDILNRYVFLSVSSGEEVKAQFIGQDFVFNQWENMAFKEIFSNMTCSELKKSGWFFTSGIYVNGKLDDFEAFTFTFK